VTLEMVFATGGIRTPRSIMCENGISLHKFSRISHLNHRTVEKLLDGNDTNVSEEQKEKFMAGLSKITRSGEQEKELKTSVG